MELFYALGVFAMLLLLFLASLLTVAQIRDQERLNHRQEQLEKSVRMELDALRERVKEVDNAEKQRRKDTAEKQ